jgi:hypothetical protein
MPRRELGIFSGVTASERSFTTFQNDWGGLANQMRTLSEGMPEAVDKWLQLVGQRMVVEVRTLIAKDKIHWTGTYFKSFNSRIVTTGTKMNAVQIGFIPAALQGDPANLERLPIYWKVLETGARPNPRLSASPRRGGDRMAGFGKRGIGKKTASYEYWNPPGGRRKEPKGRAGILGPEGSAKILREQYGMSAKGAEQQTQGARRGFAGSLLAWSYAKGGGSVLARNIVYANQSGAKGIKANPILSHFFILSGADLMVTGLTSRGMAIVESAREEVFKEFQRMVYSVKPTQFKRRGKTVVQQIVRTERGPRFGKLISIG